MLQRSLGATGLKVSRLGLGTMTWGTDTDEHEAADQLAAFLDAGGTLLDTAASYGDGETRAARSAGCSTTSSPATTGARDQGRHHPPRRRRARRRRVARRAAATTSTHRCGGSASTTSTCGRCTPGRDDVPIEETLSALDYAVSSGPSPLRRDLELLRLADRARGDLAAGWPGPGAARRRPRSSTRCSSGASSARSCRRR